FAPQSRRERVGSIFGRQVALSPSVKGYGRQEQRDGATPSDAARTAFSVSGFAAAERACTMVRWNMAKLFWTVLFLLGVCVGSYFFFFGAMSHLGHGGDRDDLFIMGFCIIVVSLAIPVTATILWMRTHYRQNGD